MKIGPVISIAVSSLLCSCMHDIDDIHKPVIRKFPGTIAMDVSKLMPTGSASSSVTGNFYVVAHYNEANTEIERSISESSPGIYGSIWVANKNNKLFREIKIGDAIDKLYHPKDIIFNEVNKLLFVCNEEFIKASDKTAQENGKNSIIAYRETGNTLELVNRWVLPTATGATNKKNDSCSKLTYLSSGLVLATSPSNHATTGEEKNDIVVYSVDINRPYDQATPWIDYKDLDPDALSTDSTTKNKHEGISGISSDACNNVYLTAIRKKIETEPTKPSENIVYKIPTNGYNYLHPQAEIIGIKINEYQKDAGAASGVQQNITASTKKIVAIQRSAKPAEQYYTILISESTTTAAETPEKGKCVAYQVLAASNTLWVADPIEEIGDVTTDKYQCLNINSYPEYNYWYMFSAKDGEDINATYRHKINLLI